MWWWYIGIYLFGGITFIPLCIAIVYLTIKFNTYRATVTKATPFVDEKDRLDAEPPATSYQGAVQASVWVYLSQYYLHVSDGADQESINAYKLTNASDQEDSARSSLKKFVQSKDNSKPTTPSAQAPRSLSKLPKLKAVVRDGHLMLYSDSQEKTLTHYIDLTEFIVVLWPPGGFDYELFYKKFAVCLIKRTGKDGVVSLDVQPRVPPKKAYFFYLDNGTDKEDLYFALIREGGTTKPQESLGPRDPKIMARPLVASLDEWRELLAQVYSIHQSPQTQWINALLGRMFLGVKGSRQIEKYLRNKITYKLTRTKPSVIGEISVPKIICGTSIPYVTEVKMADFQVNGSLTIEAGIRYNGGFSLELATDFQVALGGFIKQRSIPILLAVKLKQLTGRLVLKIKPPPSSRVWYAFDVMPKMDLEIEPIVSNTKINYGIVTKTIAMLIRDSVKESIVMPYMDDVSFFDTSDEFYRGGIWDPRHRPSQVSWDPHDELHQASSQDSLAQLNAKTSMADLGSREEPQGTDEQAKTDEYVISSAASVYSNSTTTTARRWGAWFKRSKGKPLEGDEISVHSVANDDTDSILAFPQSQGETISPYSAGKGGSTTPASLQSSNAELPKSFANRKPVAVPDANLLNDKTHKDSLTGSPSIKSKPMIGFTDLKVSGQLGPDGNSRSSSSASPRKFSSPVRTSPPGSPSPSEESRSKRTNNVPPEPAPPFIISITEPSKPVTEGSSKNASAETVSAENPIPEPKPTISFQRTATVVRKPVPVREVEERSISDESANTHHSHSTTSSKRARRYMTLSKVLPEPEEAPGSS